MWSPVRKALGLGRARLPRRVARLPPVRQPPSTAPAADDLFVWFDADLLPGYAWSFPLPGGRANVGFGVLRDGTRRIQDMKAMWAGLLDRPHIRAALGPHAAARGPAHGVADPGPHRPGARWRAGRVLLAGDAAMATDVMTGEGIGQALLTGRLAAEAIVAGGALDAADVRRPLRAAVRHHLVADHRMSARLGRVLAHRRGARARSRSSTTPATWGRRNFARWMFEDEPRAIALTPSRWHRGVLRRPGAFAGADPARCRRTRSRLAHVVEQYRRSPPRPSWTNTLASTRRGALPHGTSSAGRPAASPGPAPPTTPATRPTARRRRGRRARASPTPRGARAGAGRRTRPAAR